MRLAPVSAALALIGSSAAAGSLQRSFRVSAVVVSSARVSTTFVKTPSGEGIRVRTSGCGAPPAALLVNGVVQLLGDAKDATIAAAATENTVVTILY